MSTAQHPDHGGDDETIAQQDPGTGGPGDPPSGDEPPTDDNGLNDVRMTLLEHLSELRLRLRNAGIAFLIALIGSFFFVKKFFAVLSKPVVDGMKRAGFPDTPLNVTGVMESLWILMKLAIVASLLIASPFVLWELWKFIAPGLYKKEKRMAALVTGATAVCFIGGSLFGYLVLAEPAAYYGMSLIGPGSFGLGLEVEPELTLENVANFMMLMLAGCGAAFELPVLLSLLGWIGIISAAGLRKFWKYALVGSVVAGAVLTPSGDPLTQMLLAGPLFVLYIISIFIVMAIEKARARAVPDADPVD